MCIDWKHEFFQIQLKSLAEEMQAITKGLEKVKQELAGSENDGPVSEVFCKVFIFFFFFFSFYFYFTLLILDYISNIRTVTKKVQFIK